MAYVTDQTAGETLAVNIACYKALNGKLYAADPTDNAKMPALFVTAEAKEADEQIDCYQFDKATSAGDAWTWTIGPGEAGAIYVGTAGALTQTKPVGDVQVQIIGWAQSATTALLQPPRTSLQALRVGAGGTYDEPKSKLNIVAGSNMSVVATREADVDTLTLISTATGTVTGLPGYYSVKAADYGAHGDGTSDDTAHIQAAINAAAGSTYGGVVYFPPGTYKTTAQLTLYSNVTLDGVRGASKIYVVGTSDTNAIAFGATSNITIRNLTIYTTSYSCGYGIIWLRCSNLLIEKCELYGFAYAAIRCSSGNGTYQPGIIQDNYIHDVGTGIYGEGISGYRCNGLIIRGNIIEKIGTYLLDSPDLHGACIYLNWGTKNVIITENILSYSRTACQIQWSDASYPDENVTFSNNSIHHIRQFWFSSGGGAPETESSHGFNICGNTITGDGNYIGKLAIYNTSGLKKAFNISNNVIDYSLCSTTNLTQAISGNEIVFSNNTIKGNGGYGIILSRTDSGEPGNITNALIQGNFIYNMAVGITIGYYSAYVATDIAIVNNKIYGSSTSGTTGIDIETGATFIDIRNNSFKNLAVGIHAAAGATDILVQDNTFKTVTDTEDVGDATRADVVNSYTFA